MKRRRQPDALDAELGQLKQVFQAVAQRHHGEVRDIVLQASECLTVKSNDPEAKADAMTDAYLAAVEKLEKGGKTDLDAAAAIEDLGDAVSKSISRMTRRPGA